MEIKMEAFVNEPRPLNITGGWDQQVNDRANKAEEERTRQRAEDARKRQAAWEEEQRAKSLETRRARRISFWIMFGLALILAGGIGMNYIKDFSFPLSAGLAILGVAAYMFCLGWIIGHRAR